MKKRIFSLLLALLTVTGAVVFTAPVSASSVQTEGHYTFVVQDGKATITAVSTAISGDVTIPDTLGGYPVTAIADGVFFDSDAITTVTVPKGIGSIGKQVFAGCNKLTAITVDAANTAYMSENGVLFSKDKKTLIVCPAGKTGAYTVPDGVTTIGDSAFHSCTRLTGITVPNSVTEIGGYAFYNCSGLTSVNIPDGVTEIGNYTFYNCESLTSITIPDGVTEIGDYAFYFCYNLTSITIPNGVTVIGDYTFGFCSALTNISLPNSVTEIGEWAFSHCNNLTSITVPSGVTEIAEHTFFCCTSLTTVIIPNGVTTIGDYAFYECSSLTSISIPNSVTRINHSAFHLCRNLTSAIVPVSVTSIGGNAFYQCPNLVIYGYSGTTAETHATANNIRFFSLGSAATPVITVQPTDVTCTQGDTVTLSVTATSPDNGTLSYQWYNDTGYTTGSGAYSIISGATGSSCTVPTDWVAENYYFVIVSNTAANGAVATARSNTVKVTVNRAVSFSGIIEPAPISYLPNGTPLSAFPLPTTVSITTGAGTMMSAAVTWDTANCGYDPTKTSAQMVVISGTITLPAGVTNPNNISLTTSIRVGVLAASGGTVTPTENKQFVGFLSSSVIYDIPNGTELQSVLPPTLTANILHFGNPGGASTEAISVPVRWNLAAAEKKYDKSNPHMQHVEVTGEASLPVDVSVSSDRSTAFAIHLWFAADPTSHSTKSTPTDGAVDATLLAMMLASMQNDKTVQYVTAAAGVGGTVSPAGAVALTNGQQVVYTVLPNAGYEIASVQLNGTDMGAVASLTVTGTKAAQSLVVTFRRTPAANPFTDVTEKDAHYEAVLYMLENGIMKGVSKSKFAPEKTMNRAMFVETLGRMEEVDTAYYTDNAFSDLADGSSSAAYAQWAAENGIVTGYADGSFGSSSVITTEAAAVILYRYAKYTGVSVKVASVDVEGVSDWAAEAMAWAVQSGICTDDAPQSPATRAMVAQMLYCFCTAVIPAK